MQTLQHYSIQIRKNSKRCHNNSNTKNLTQFGKLQNSRFFTKTSYKKNYIDF